MRGGGGAQQQQQQEEEEEVGLHGRRIRRREAEFYEVLFSCHAQHPNEYSHVRSIFKQSIQKTF